MVCTLQFLPLLNKNKINLSQIAQIMLISLEFSPVGYCIHPSVLLGQPHVVSTRENSLRPLELIYTHKNVDFDFFSPFMLLPLYSNFWRFCPVMLQGFMCLILQRQIQLTSKASPTAVMACMVRVWPAELMKAKFHLFCRLGSWPAIKINAIFSCY